MFNNLHEWITKDHCFVVFKNNHGVVLHLTEKRSRSAIEGYEPMFILSQPIVPHEKT